MHQLFFAKFFHADISYIYKTSSSTPYTLGGILPTGRRTAPVYLHGGSGKMHPGAARELHRGALRHHRSDGIGGAAASIPLWQSALSVLIWPLIALGLADVSYGTWVKYSWKFQAANLLLTSALLLLGLSVGYM